MAARRLDGGEARVRRATRHDLPALRALLATAAAGRSERFDRRMLRALASDVYVAEEPAAGLVGAVALSFARSFAAGHWRAHLDGLWVAPGRDDLTEPLVAFALGRAERRNCRDVLVAGPLAGPLRAALERRGFTAGTCWRAALAPADARGPERGPGRGS